MPARLVISGHMNGHALRFVGPDSDELIDTFPTFDAAADAYRSARDVLSMLADALAKPHQPQA